MRKPGFAVNFAAAAVLRRSLRETGREYTKILFWSEFFSAKDMPHISLNKQLIIT
jgi:hypothetical protein